MKKGLILILASSFISLNAYAAKVSVNCDDYNLRSSVTEDDNPYIYKNKYSVDGCDLGFDFPGFSFDVNIGSLDFCSVAKSVTSQAKDSWNQTVNNVNQWTESTTNVNPTLSSDGKTGSASVDINSSLINNLD